MEGKSELGRGERDGIGEGEGGTGGRNKRWARRVEKRSSQQQAYLTGSRVTDTNDRANVLGQHEGSRWRE